MKTRSRLYRRLENKTKKNLLLSVLGIIVVLIFIFKVGIPLLVNFSLFVGNLKGKNESINKKNTVDFVSAPVLNPLPSATNSAGIKISGIASSNQTISLYINDELLDKTGTDRNGNFSFDGLLKTGENIIKVKSKENDKESDFSQSLTVMFKDKPPALFLNSPQDGQTFKKDDKTANIQGKTDEGTTVTVNGFRAIVDAGGNFSYTLPLQNGDNHIKIMAEDEAGNKTEKEIKVIYNP